ncbi:mitochondrial outer membrane translocase receptor, subunit TOM70 [Heterobasidion irregulare TC 32-1]|uniref:Mitochondrial outer membrane translocase receptor, subunit TOM70 n=1 Tax=Heterobasidion irregulare (strain TC 32-1) TaxID=747525 RepID=W4JT85_HETIT|nr:mitochondrial outer membrane translocase receptor, subunit TOM70 [Heterobasidion irregulare TC 32-1]ETW76674.1 mitochondrial outer membrane translocase receptor, subunit TOM70 [Heterobasidion irregulare TC 32-1]
MSSDDALLDRLQSFVSENRRGVLIAAAAAAAVIAIGGVAYYNGAAGGDDEESLKSDKKKDKKKQKKQKKSVKDKDGPILEERKPKGTEVSDDAAASLKLKGNNAYQGRKFAVAADFYSRAIEVSPKPEPVFYSNRAACYINMSPPKFDLVVEDCDKALALDSKYVKALNRRATALENLSRYEEALRDYTAATILDKFQNEAASQAVERVLKKLSGEKATEILASREPRLPSFTFVSAYFAAFRPRPLPALPEEPSTGDNTLIMALSALEASDYAHALTLVNEALEQGISWNVGRAEALNLRGTFKFLTGDINGSKEDLNASIELVPSLTQSWVKIASVHMEQNDPVKTFECFEEAIKHNSEDPDIYYHRGQVLFIMNEFQQAAENYTKSTSLDPDFVFSHIQLAVAQYKSGDLAKSMATFRRTLREFPQKSEPQNYYGELLLDQQRFQDAVEKFDRAIELERLKTPVNVLPLVNKGLALYQWKQDSGAAERCCLEALRIDPECEAAIATLAQLSLQQGKVDQAVQMFERQTKLARSEPELANALTYQYASYAQLEFMKNYPELASQLSQLARSMV